VVEPVSQFTAEVMAPAVPEACELLAADRRGRAVGKNYLAPWAAVCVNDEFNNVVGAVQNRRPVHNPARPVTRDNVG
jgi:hypothetical protein